jgi:hypothetical protein
MKLPLLPFGIDKGKRQQLGIQPQHILRKGLGRPPNRIPGLLGNLMKMINLIPDQPDQVLNRIEVILPKHDDLLDELLIQLLAPGRLDDLVVARVGLELF